MKAHLRILFTLTCVLTLMACTNNEEKKQTNPTSEKNTEQKNEGTAPQKENQSANNSKNQDSTKPSTGPDSKSPTLNQKSINYVKELFELAKEGKYLMFHLLLIQEISKK